MNSRSIPPRIAPQESSELLSSSTSSLSAVESALVEFSNSLSVITEEDWPLRDMIDQVMKVSGIPDLEAATLACLSALSAAVADCVQLSYSGQEINSSVNILFAGGESFGESVYLGLPFALLRQITRSDLFRGKDQSMAEERVRQANLRLSKSRKVEDHLYEKLESELRDLPGANPETVYRRAKFAAGLSPNELFGMSSAECAAAAHQQALETSETAKVELGEAYRAIRPLLISESIGLDDVLRARRFATRNAILSVGGTTRELRQLLQSSERLRSEFASVCRASFDNAVIIDKLQPKPAPWFSFIYLADGELVRRYINDRTIVDEGLAGRTLVVDLTSKPATMMELQAALETCPLYSSLLQAWHWSRSKHDRFEVDISKDALKAYGVFVNDINQLSRDLPELRPFIEHWPVMALKLALLLHASTGTTISKSIPKQSMEHAIHLLRVAGGQGLLMLLHRGELKPPADARMETEIELLVAKIRMKGPLSRRDLVRSYHGKRMTVLESLLSRAIGMGLIEEAQGLLRPALPTM